MLYALRFEANANFSLKAVLDLLKSKCPSQSINAVKLILDYAGQRRRQNDVFGNRSAMEMTKRFIKGRFSSGINQPIPAIIHLV
jgi:hypothetical protein